MYLLFLSDMDVFQKYKEEREKEKAEAQELLNSPPVTIADGFPFVMSAGQPTPKRRKPTKVAPIFGFQQPEADIKNNFVRLQDIVYKQGVMLNNMSDWVLKQTNTVSLLCENINMLCGKLNTLITVINDHEYFNACDTDTLLNSMTKDLDNTSLKSECYCPDCVDDNAMF